MSEEDGVREFKITGGAVEAKKSRTRKQKGGDNLALSQVADTGAQGVATQYASSVGRVLANSFGPDKAQQFGGKKQTGGNTGAIVNLASTRTAPSPGPVAPLVSGAPLSSPAPVGGGNSGLVLAPRRKNRISLKAKKGGSTSSGVGDVPPPGGGGTRKARKIHLRVKGVTARVAKAKKAKKEAMAAPISQVKSKLESAVVIKKGSKAPEGMLRTMYADLLITKKGL